VLFVPSGSLKRVPLGLCRLGWSCCGEPGLAFCNLAAPECVGFVRGDTNVPSGNARLKGSIYGSAAKACQVPPR
jgi:hypothetical protein